MDEEKTVDQTTEAEVISAPEAAETAPAVAEPAAEGAPAPKQRRKRRTKAEIEADKKKAEAKAKRAAKKAAAAAEKAAGEALDTVAKAAKQVVDEGAQAAEKITRPRIPTPEIVVQYSGIEVGASALTDAAVAQFRAVKKRAKISDIKIYVKPEEHAAYFVINGDFTGKVDF